MGALRVGRQDGFDHGLMLGEGAGQAARRAKLSPAERRQPDAQIGGYLGDGWIVKTENCEEPASEVHRVV